MTSAVLTSVGYGRAVGLRVDEALLPALRPWLPFWWRSEQVDAEQIWDVRSPDECERAVRDLELWVAEHAVDRVFVHAGVVAVRGGAILLPGRTFTGKSTLVTALLKAGAEYGSDEYAVLDATGMVWPYPRPISVRQPDGSRCQVTAEELGASPFVDALRVTAVASLRHVSGTGTELAELSPSAAVLDLLDNTVCAQSRPDEALAACAAAVDSSRLVAGVRGDSSDAAQQLLLRLA